MKPDRKPIPRFSAKPSDPAFYNNPYPVYAQMHDIGRPFVWEEYGFICFAGYHLVDRILRDRRFGRQLTHLMSREEAGLPEIPPHLESFYGFEANSMLELEPPEHTRLRRLVNRAFVARKIEQLAPQIEALCHQLIDAFPTDEPFDLLPAYCQTIPVIVIADLLGIPAEMAGQLLDWSHKMVAMYQFQRTRQMEEDAVTATAEFSAYIRELAQQRRIAPRQDLLTAMVEAEDGSANLSMDELVTTAILLLNAGHEATVHGIGNAVKALLENDAVEIAGLMDDATSAVAIEELLRFDPPLHLFTRYVLEDLELAGMRLTKGQTIGLLLGAANHDHEKYAKPAQLNFTRGGMGHVSFGAGIHFCLGAPLARLEMTIALRCLFERRPSLGLSGAPEYANRFHFHGLQRLMVR